MPCPEACSPLVTPDVRISRIRRSQILLAAGVRKELTARLHRHQTEVGQLTIPGGSFRWSEGSLAPPAQVSVQTLSNIPAVCAERLPGMARYVCVLPDIQLSVDLYS